MMSDEKGKWKDILVSKYGLELGRSQARLKYQSWWWRDLFKVCGEGEDDGCFKKLLFGKLGTERMLDFGRMCGSITLTLSHCILDFTPFLWAKVRWWVR